MTSLTSRCLYQRRVDGVCSGGTCVVAECNIQIRSFRTRRFPPDTRGNYSLQNLFPLSASDNSKTLMLCSDKIY